MKLKDFIDILKTFNPDDEIIFYCPTNKTHYFIHKLDVVSSNTIILTINHTLSRCHTAKQIIWVYDGSIQNNEFKLIHEHQEFKIQ